MTVDLNYLQYVDINKYVGNRATPFPWTFGTHPSDQQYLIHDTLTNACCGKSSHEGCCGYPDIEGDYFPVAYFFRAEDAKEMDSILESYRLYMKLLQQIHAAWVNNEDCLESLIADIPNIWLLERGRNGF